jgi:hypothetical protein
MPQRGLRRWWWWCWRCWAFVTQVKPIFRQRLAHVLQAHLPEIRLTQQFIAGLGDKLADRHVAPPNYPLAVYRDAFKRQGVERAQRQIKLRNRLVEDIARRFAHRAIAGALEALRGAWAFGGVAVPAGATSQPRLAAQRLHHALIGWPRSMST